MVETTSAHPVVVTAEDLGVSQGEEYSGPLEYDLGSLTASSHNPVDQERFKADPNSACLDLATQITQSLVARLFELPSEAAPMGRIAHLPAPTTPLPRAKPLPKPRAPTKWEQFAQRKGIVKKKRTKEVWDEQAGEYRRRYGYKRAADESEVPILEATADDQVGEDPFTKLRQEKKERVKAQHKRQVANIKASAKTTGSSGALPPTLKLAAALPEHGKGKPTKRKEMKDDIAAASRQAGVSTASMGKFDATLPGEKPGERTLAVRRHKFDPVAGSAAKENKKALGLVDRILREQADDIVDTDKAVRRVEAERHRQLASSRDEGDDDADDDNKQGHGKAKKGWGKGGKQKSTKGQRFAALKRGEKGQDRKGGVSKVKGGRGAGGKGRGGKGKTGTKR